MALITVGWIVCRGSERQVAHGRVDCPAPNAAARTRMVRVEDCLGMPAPHCHTRRSPAGGDVLDRCIAPMAHSSSCLL